MAAQFCIQRERKLAHAIKFLVVCAHALDHRAGSVVVFCNAVLLAEICAAPGKEGNLQ